MAPASLLREARSSCTTRRSSCAKRSGVAGSTPVDRPRDAWILRLRAG